MYAARLQKGCERSRGTRDNDLLRRKLCCEYSEMQELKTAWQYILKTEIVLENYQDRRRKAFSVLRQLTSVCGRHERFKPARD